MTRFFGASAILALSLVAAPAMAHQGQMSTPGTKSSTTAAKSSATTTEKSSSITGEIVDTGCYLGSGERGAKHVSCATKCIANGMPMGLLTADGTLYLLTLNHDNPDPYNQLKNLAGKTVTVTGPVMKRSGMQGLDVEAFKTSTAK
jgi:hypothetical protein